MSRHYAAVRTDRTKQEFICRELAEGRLRQGWGWSPDHDLRLLRDPAKRNALGPHRSTVWRNRRLLDTEPDGLKAGDIVLLPNLPRDGVWLLARITGPYRFELSTVVSDAGTEDYGHIVPAELIRMPSGAPAVVHPENRHVDARLRATMHNRQRLWSIDALGGAVERLLDASARGEDTSEPQPEVHRYNAFFASVRNATWEALKEKYQGAELEKPIRRLLAAVYVGGRVEHWGGPAEKGADLIVYTQDPLGLEYRVGVQVKLYDGVHDDPHALKQIRLAYTQHRLDAAVVISTAESTSDSFEAERAALEEETGIDVKVILRDELVELIMKHLNKEA